MKEFSIQNKSLGGFQEKRITDFSNRQECWSRIRFRIGRTTDFATTSTGWSIKAIGETAVGFSALKPKATLILRFDRIYEQSIYSFIPG
jgi:hypothetical protein